MEPQLDADREIGTAPAFDWQSIAPADAGLSAEKLAAVRDDLAARNTHCLLVARGDHIAYEWYAPEWHAGRTHYLASLTKALVGGTSLLLALQDGLLRADDLAVQYVPEWADDPLKSQITIRHLATHTSGIENAEQDGLPHDQLPGWKGAFWKRDPDPFTLSRDVAPIIFPPGTRYHYSNPGMAMLAYCVTAALQNTPHSDIRTLLAERVFTPIGLQPQDWSIGYGTTYHVSTLPSKIQNPQSKIPLVANWGGSNLTARAVARLGRLMLRQGNWEGTQILDPDAVQQAISYAGMPLPEQRETDPAPGSGLCWYTNFDGIWPDVPRDAFGGAGAGHQLLLVIPSQNLLVVRLGNELRPATSFSGDSFWATAYQHVFAPLVASSVASTGQPLV